ncbi:MAG TPA: alpha/beta hydrolase [Actinomycetota bacterium]|nr:alpha/beta hydrolase [Actinomycetota bacterium]
MAKRNALALAGAAVGLGAGLVAQRSLVNRRRRNDPEGGEPFGRRRGVRARTIERPDGSRIFIEEAGPESPRGAVFIHGSVLRSDVWHYQLAGMGDHRLVFYDLRGHGLSHPKGSSGYSVTTLADDLAAVIEDSGLEEVVIVGHSVGGMIALQLCHLNRKLLGSKIRGLVLTNTTHRPAYETLVGGAGVAKVERLVRRPLDMLGSQHHQIERLRRILKPSDSVFLAVAFAAFGPHASAKQIDFTYDMLTETPTDVIFDLIKAYRDFDVTDHLGDITVPALVIAGTHDRLTVSEASEHLVQHLPKAELQLLHGCGHMTMLERYREFNDLVGRFLDDTLG